MPDIYGVAPLRNGKWIFSSKLGVGIVDPAVGPSAPPVSTFWNDASYPGNLGSFGRACVPTAFVDALSRDAG